MTRCAPGTAPCRARRPAPAAASPSSRSRAAPAACPTHLERYPERARDRFFHGCGVEEPGRGAGRGRAYPDTAARRGRRGAAARAHRLSPERNPDLEWAHVDLETGVLRLADSKTGARNSSLRTAPPSARRAATRQALSGYPARGRPAAQQVDARTRVGPYPQQGQADERTHHDLRHTIGTSAGALGLNAFTIRDLSGHPQFATTSRYMEYTHPLRKAADQAVAPIAAALAAGAAGSESNRCTPGPSHASISK